MALGSPPRKVDALLAAMAAGHWPKAIKMAARWPKLGEQREAIKAASAALLSPDFYRGLGQDPEAMIAAGIEALKARYGHMQHQQPSEETPMTAAKKLAPKEDKAPRIGLRKYVLEAEGATKAKLALLEAQLPKLAAAIEAVSSQAAAERFRDLVIGKLPTETPLERAWRMQHIDSLNRRMRDLKAKRA